MVRSLTPRLTLLAGLAYTSSLRFGLRSYLSGLISVHVRSRGDRQAWAFRDTVWRMLSRPLSSFTQTRS
jgi:hypothetical protein